MEEETEVYVFDSQEQSKENNFDQPYQFLPPNPPSSKPYQPLPKPPLQTFKESIFAHHHKEQEESQEEEEDSEEEDPNYYNNQSARREYQVSKNAEKIEEYHKNKYNTHFYHISSVQGTQKQVMNITNSQQFILNPLHPNILLECTMVKVKNGLFSYSWEVYSQNKFLMSVHKLSGLSSKYKIYSHKKQCETNYVGRVEANFLGTEWFIFDSGTNPQRSRNLENVRKMLGSINYQSNMLRTKGVRRMEVYLPAPIEEALKSFSCLQTTNILKRIYDKQSPIVSRFTNKLPEFCEEQRCYKQDFGGKIKTTSVKNMIIIDEETQKERLLFGKVNQEVYYFEAKYPFSPLQALGVSLSSVESKIAVE